MLRKVERFQQTKQEWPKAIGYKNKWCKNSQSPQRTTKINFHFNLVIEHYLPSQQLKLRNVIINNL